MCVALGRRSNLPPVMCVALIAWVLWNVDWRTQELLQRGFLSGPNFRKNLLYSLIIIRTLKPSRGGPAITKGVSTITMGITTSQTLRLFPFFLIFFMDYLGCNSDSKKMFSSARSFKPWVPCTNPAAGRFNEDNNQSLERLCKNIQYIFNLIFNFNLDSHP